MKTTRTKEPVTHSHTDRLNQPILPDSIVAFCYTGGNTMHIGRVARITRKRVRIAYRYEHTATNGNKYRWESDYQAQPQNILVLNNLEQQLTVLALRGLV